MINRPLAVKFLTNRKYVKYNDTCVQISPSTSPSAERPESVKPIDVELWTRKIEDIKVFL